jgi:hypothetical protein
MKKQDIDPMYYNACLSCGDKESNCRSKRAEERKTWLVLP